MHRLLTAALLLVSCTPAMATGWIEARIADGTYEFDQDDADIDLEAEGAAGFDLRAQFDATPNLFLRGEYLSSEADEAELNGDEFDIDIEAEVLRGGVGLQSGSTVKMNLELESEEANEDGFAMSGGLKDGGTAKFLWNVELGLVQLDDTDGGTFDVTLGYRFNPTVAVFGGAQSYVFGEDDDNDGELSLVHLTGGVRLSF